LTAGLHRIMSPFEKVMAEINRSRQEDPAGRELDYAQRMTAWLVDLDASPDPLLRIAARVRRVAPS
jgi:hypothetical protein